MRAPVEGGGRAPLGARSRRAHSSRSQRRVELGRADAPPGNAEAREQPPHEPYLERVPAVARPGLERCLKVVDAGQATAGGEDLPRALESLCNTFTAQLALASMQSGSATPTLNIS